METPTDNAITEEELFAAAMDLPAEQQAAYLEGACSDPELKNRVRKLLSLHHDTGFMAPLDQTAGHLQHQSGLRPERAGDWIGRYKLVEVLGDGGFGVVWLAEQKAPVQREVALKIIRLGMDTVEVLMRFEQERQALALMDHPNIAKVYDAGTTSTGRPYFVMELVRGVKITDYCDAHRLSTPERLKLAAMICHALQHAHQKGIIHRDLKPSNILVAHQDGKPLPKVIDFGVAKAVDQRLTERTLVTHVQQIVGTPMYMSPEQAEGGSLDVDTRSDIYSFGVVLYELLTGCPLVDPKEVRKGLEEMRRKLLQDPRKPSTALSSLNAEALKETAQRRGAEASRLVHAIRGDLDWIVMKCLEKDRERRYESATELAMDLQRHLEDRPVLARPPTRAYLLGRFMSRHRLGVAAGVVVALSVIGGLTASMILLVREKAASRRAVAAEALSAERAVAAREAARRYRQGSYVSDMLLAQSAVQDSNFSEARDLLEAYLPVGGEEDIRGLEWRMLWNDTKPEMLKKFQHDTMVSSVSLSPDGRLAATCCLDGKARLWDTESGKVVAEFPWRSAAGRNWLRQIQFSPDGKCLALARSGGIELRQAPDWTPLQTLPDGEAPCAFSPDGKLLATTSAKDRTSLVVWDTATWQKKPLNIHWPSGNFHLSAWAPDSHHLYLSSDGRHRGLSCYNVTQPEDPPAVFDAVDAKSLAVSPKGNWVATGNADGYLNIFDTITQENVCEFKAHKNRILALAFSPDGSHLVSGAGDQMLRYWDATQKPVDGELQLMGSFVGHRSVICACAFSQNDGKLLSAGEDGIAALWPKKPDVNPTRFIHPPSRSPVIGFTPGEKTIESYLPPNLMIRWDLVTGQMISRLPLPDSPVDGAVVSLPGDILVYGTAKGFLKILDEQHPEKIISRQLGPQSVRPLSAAPDGSVVAIEMGAKCFLMDTKDGHEVARISGYRRFGAPFKTVAFSQNSSLLAFPRSNSRVGVWDVKQNRLSRTFVSGGLDVCTMAFSPDSKWLAASSSDGQVRIWEVASGLSPLPPIEEHRPGIFRLEFSPDGRTLIASADDRKLNYWNVATGRLVRSEDGKGVMSEPCTFSPSGRYLLLGDGPVPDIVNIFETPSLAEIDAGRVIPPLPPFNPPPVMQPLAKSLPPFHPTTVGDFMAVADDQVRHGKLALATEYYRKVIELDPTVEIARDVLSIVLAFRGDREAWNKLVTANLQRAKNDPDLHTAERTAKECLLLPPVDSHNLEDADRLLLKALAPAGQTKSFYPWARLFKSLCDYRRGKYPSSVDLSEGLIGHHNSYELDVAAWAILYMSLHRQGSSRLIITEALPKLRGFYDTLSLPEQRDPGYKWPDVLVCATLLREAIAVLEQPKGK